ncbi:MAG: amidase domain-containing protein, partial [Ruminococcus sp.]|nr:amidase domain-containing protein [Ruminococcus sp.]
MSKKLKQLLASMLVVLMLLTSAPLSGVADYLGLPKAQALNYPYSAGAAAEYAKQWWNGRNTAIWSDYDLWGGDCANFVCQSLYAGGIPMTPNWYFHKRIGRNEHAYTTERTESFTVVSKMSNYLCSIGGQYIEYPSASQVSIGDVMIYNWSNDGVWDHCGICTDIINGVPQIACHTSNSLDTNWVKGAYKWAVIKMGGATCTNSAPSYDVYIVTNQNNIYQRKEPYAWAERTYSSIYNDYILHVVETRYDSNGTLWGYCKVKGVDGWANLSGNASYITHVNRYEINHAMGSWRVVVEPTCTTVGVEERVCSKCGYTERRNMSIGGKHRNIIEADCLNPSYCTACGKVIGDPLGHDFGDWVYDIAPTCTEGGTEKRICSRCGYTESRDVDALGHDYAVGVTGPNCTNTGTYTYTCSRCGDSYVGYQDENNTWSDWTTDKLDLPADKVKTKTQYRSRTKETSTSSSSTKNGWTLYDTTYVWSNYGNWSGWQDGYVSSSDSRKVETRNVTMYNYYHYRLDKGNNGQDVSSVPMNKTDYNNMLDKYGFSWKKAASEEYHTISLDYELGRDPNLNYVAGDWNVPCYIGYNTGHEYCGVDNWTVKDCNWFQQSNYITNKTQYRYADRNKIYTYHFYKWNPWSAWQDEKIKGNDLTETESRTVYSYDLKALGHLPVLSDEKNYYENDVEVAYSETGDYGKCFWRGEYCQREGCGVHLNTEYANHSFPVFDPDNIDESVWTLAEESTDDLVLYKAYCTEGCGCYVIQGHKFIIKVVPPTCCEDGYTLHTCEFHGEEYITDKVPALGHECDEQWEIIKYPTCTEAGEQKSHCVRFDNGETCDKVYTKPILPIGHKLTKTDAVPATCIEDGNTEYYYCENCNKYFSDADGETEIEKNSWIIVKLGHELYEHDDYDENGKRGWYFFDCNTDERDCQRDGCTYSEYRYERNNHKFEVVKIVDPTCTMDGFTEYECSICQLIHFESVEPLGHIEGETTVVLPTCTEDGWSQWTCQRKGCKEEYADGTEGPHIERFKFVDATGHALSPNDDEYETSDDKMELIGSVPNECGEGTIDTYRCTHINNGVRCDYTVVIGEFIDHDWGPWKITPPKCEIIGKKERECRRCHAMETEIIDVLEHDYQPVEIVPPTCTENGYTLYVCQNDPAHWYKGDFVPATGHDWGEWKIVMAATCTEDGEKQRVCKNDAAHIETETISHFGHKWDDGVIAPDSDCVNHGVKTYTCQNDASHTKTEEVPLDPDKHIGTTYIKNEKEATCLEDGYTGDTYCKGCNVLLKKGEPIPATGHDWGEWKVVTPAECEKNGLERRTCANDASHVDEREVVALCHEWGETTYTWSEDNTTCTAFKPCNRDYEHDLEEKVEVEISIVDSTCEKDGQKTYTATFENEAFSKQTKTEIINKKGHDMGDNWYVYTEPTYDKEGEERNYCQRNGCDYYEHKPIAKLKYKITFVVVNDDSSEKLVKSVEYEKGTQNISAPAVPSKDGFVGTWEDYELNSAPEIKVKAVYEPKSSDNTAELETDKTAEYDEKTGVATIELNAFAKAHDVYSNMLSGTPLDIILVVDQSRSMAWEMGKNDVVAKPESKSRKGNLKKVATDFVNTVYDNAVSTGKDHRISVVGFASASNLGYENTGLRTPNSDLIRYDKIKNNQYRDSLMSVQSSKNVILEAINKIESNGATAAELGLEMAANVFANNKINTAERKRLVIFLTDGTPTHGSNFDNDVANKAINESNKLKTVYEATVYSVGITSEANPADNKESFNKFLHRVSSNYKNSTALNNGEGSINDGYYISATNTEVLQNIFNDIYYRTIKKTVPFDNVTFHDTISEYFTLTTEQENELRENLKKDYGLTSDDITIIRNDDGTTTLEVRDVNTKKVYNSANVMTGYGASIRFNVTANEKALNAGIYDTNTDDAYLEISENKAAEFEIPQITINSSRNIVKFNIGDETYSISQVDMGDLIVAPDIDYAHWNIGENEVVTKSFTEFNAVLSSSDRYVFWNVDGKVITHSYKVGQVITPPEVEPKDDVLFDGWGAEVPYRMPDVTSLSFTAEWAHKHNYTELVGTDGDCETGIVKTYACLCGETKVERLPATSHTYEASILNVNEKSVATIRCTQCGTASEKTLIYAYRNGTRGDYQELKLYNAEGVSVQPDGSIQIRLPIPDSLKGKKNIVVYRYENGRYVSLSATVEDGAYIVFVTDHFSTYVITTDDVDTSTIDNEGIICEIEGHAYTERKVAPTCEADGYTVHTCSVCGNSYTDGEVKATGHTDNDGDGYCDNCNKFLKENP